MKIVLNFKTCLANFFIFLIFFIVYLLNTLTCSLTCYFTCCFLLQEERQRTKERDQNEVESTSSMHTDMPVERILEAEKRVECKNESAVGLEVTFTYLNVYVSCCKLMCTAVSVLSVFMAL